MKQKIYKFLIDYLNQTKPIDDITEEELLDYRYLDNGHIDSFGLIQFIMAIEEEFDITLEPEDTESDEFRHIKGLIQIIEKKL